MVNTLEEASLILVYTACVECLLTDSPSNIPVTSGSKPFITLLTDASSYKCSSDPDIHLLKYL